MKSRLEYQSVDHRLNAERAATLHRIASLTRQFDAIVESSALTTNDDEHDPEGTTVAFERAQVSALLAGAKKHLVAVDQAITRLLDGSYGVCGRCGQAIAEERLAALPVVATCIGCTSRTRR
ncbi:MAG TPA: TraR/DksA C4-type zinc finger protein [Pseudonocardiaceae bacterium]|nr:TraR/DksA C4-type zinc finger protein [Pseudonocardiaceae bacterium]